MNNDTPARAEQARRDPARADGWLWASAAALTGLTLVASTGALQQSAIAEMVSSAGTYTMMTTDGGTDEVLVVVDDRTEQLLVYQVLPGGKFELADREGLPEIFVSARKLAGAP